jgi:elongator complex protein 3
MVVTNNSELTKLWEAWKYKPYDDETLVNLTATLESLVPEYVRLNRTYRDIPSSEILAGSHLANLRQIVEDKLKKEWRKLLDIRHREIKFGKNDPSKATFHNYEYEASWWTEHFLTIEDPEDRTIFSLLRLRLTEDEEKNKVAIIRELHTFWEQLSIWEKWNNTGQHLWFWKKLLLEAENIAKFKGYDKILVISGVGVRQYYEKRGYKLKGEYMIKEV